MKEVPCIEFEIQTKILGPRASKEEDERNGIWMNPSCFTYQIAGSHIEAVKKFLRYGIFEYQGRNWRVRAIDSLDWLYYSNVNTKIWDGREWFERRH